MYSLRLYSKAQCPLCEEAIELIGLVIDGQTEGLKIMDVTSDDELFERYGTRVPVLVNLNSSVELGWPFGVADVARLINEKSGT